MSEKKLILNRGVTIWLTGLSGAGKTTIGHLLKEKLRKWGIKVEVLDGDKIRQHLTADLGFSKQDREKMQVKTDIYCRIPVSANFL
ncbi:adenylyl-sulfate kinase [Desulforamulus putei]|uniref:Adenylylsulphate kinase n=1 Tax=Desulforamulus putei DSM 12395 TaxID=1121429 RepID=A0A1M4S8V8_9FIRM|nr:adenylyl-sulfate kinase [Desulforamulus putei]SHE28598.1 Adenylylsulphate kinase [Desulforamulus putei DSM 12395]